MIGPVGAGAPAGAAAGSAADAADAARTAARGLEPVARVGFAVSGVLHLLVAYLGLRAALGAADGSTDASGAVTQVAGTTAGRVLLLAAAASLAVLALWALVVGPLSARAHHPGKAVAQVSRAVVYAVLAWTCLTAARGGRPSGETSSDDATAVVLGAPGGLLLVLAVGLTVLGVGVFHVVKGSTRKLAADLGRLPGPARDPRVRRLVLVTGRVGYVAKGLALGVVGVLFVLAALQHRPREAGGLDEAARAVLAVPAGRELLVAAAAGFAAYGLWSFVRARWGDLR